MCGGFEMCIWGKWVWWFGVGGLGGVFLGGSVVVVKMWWFGKAVRLCLGTGRVVVWWFRGG